MVNSPKASCTSFHRAATARTNYSGACLPSAVVSAFLTRLKYSAGLPISCRTYSHGVHIGATGPRGQTAEYLSRAVLGRSILNKRRDVTIVRTNPVVTINLGSPVTLKWTWLVQQGWRRYIGIAAVFAERVSAFMPRFIFALFFTRAPAEIKRTPEAESWLIQTALTEAGQATPASRLIRGKSCLILIVLSICLFLTGCPIKQEQPNFLDSIL